MRFIDKTGCKSAFEKGKDSRGCEYRYKVIFDAEDNATIERF